MRVYLIAAACITLAGCQSEYEIIPIDPNPPVCQYGCVNQRASSWDNDISASKAGSSVEIAAWGYATTPSGPITDKARRTVFAGAPALDSGRVYYLRADMNDGRLATVAPKVLTPSGSSIAEFGAALLAVDVRSGFQPPPVHAPFLPVPPEAYGEEILVGAPGSYSNAGSLFWYHNQGTHAEPFQLGGEYKPSTVGAGDRFGAAIAASVTLDAMYPDESLTQVPKWIAVGAPGEGTVYILGVNPALAQPFSVLQKFSGGGAGGRFGSSLVVADFDGDGNDDLVVGAPGNSTGRVHVYRGSSSATTPIVVSSVGVFHIPYAGADEFGAALAAGHLRDGNGSTMTLVVGDPARDGTYTDEGIVCQMRFIAAPTGKLSVDWSRCDGADKKYIGYRFGHAIAVGNFGATSTDGSASTTCAAAEEVAVSSPGEGIYSLSPFEMVPLAGAVRILAQSEDGAEPSMEPLQIHYGEATEQIGGALAADYIQRNAHEDLVIGAPLRASNFGGMSLTRAERPNGTCDDMSGTWRAYDSAGDPFDLQIDWNGSTLEVRMLSEATIHILNGSGNHCAFSPLEGAVALPPVAWTSCGVDAQKDVTMQVEGFTLKGTLGYDASDAELTITIEESPVDLLLGCHIDGNPLVFTRIDSNVCD